MIGAPAATLVLQPLLGHVLEGERLLLGHRVAALARVGTHAGTVANARRALGDA